MVVASPDGNSEKEPDEPIVQLHLNPETGELYPCIEFLFTKEALGTLIEDLTAIYNAEDHFHYFTEDWGAYGLCNRRVIPEYPLIHQVNFRVIPDMPPDKPTLREPEGVALGYVGEPLKSLRKSWLSRILHRRSKARS